MKDFSTPLLVVAVALIDRAGRVLMQRRPSGGMHGGLWEFPGGKVEPGEELDAALVREIDEELGIQLDSSALWPLSFASDHGRTAGRPLVILLYGCRDWSGEVKCLGAEELRWCDAVDLPALAMPPLDVPLARDVIRLVDALDR